MGRRAGLCWKGPEKVAGRVRGGFLLSHWVKEARKAGDFQRSPGVFCGGTGQKARTFGLGCGAGRQQLENPIVKIFEKGREGLVCFATSLKGKPGVAEGTVSSGSLGRRS